MTLEEVFEAGCQRCCICGCEFLDQATKQSGFRPALNQGGQESAPVACRHQTPRASCGAQQQMPSKRAELLGAIDQHHVVRLHDFR